MKAILILTAAIVTLLSIPFSAQSQPQIINAPQGGPIGWFLPIATNPPIYSQPAAVWANNLNTYFVAYRSSLNEIIVTRVLPNGALNGSYTPAVAREFYSRSTPDLAYDPDHQQMLVVWEEIDPLTGYWDIKGRIANNTGNVSANDFFICYGIQGAQCFHPSVAYSRVQNRYLVVWQRTSGSTASGNIEGEFVNWDGQLKGGIFIRMAAGMDSFAQPDVAFNHISNEFLVAFQLVDCNNGFPCQTDILGHRVNYLDQVLDGPFGIRIGYNTVPERDPVVAANPDDTRSKCWVIAWTFQYKPDPLDRDIHHNLLKCDGGYAEGTAEGGWALSSTILDDYDPAITWSESAHRYLAVWTLTTSGLTSTLAGVELNTSGDPASAFRQIGGFNASKPTVAAGPKGEFLVAYTETDLFFPNQQQIHARLWGNRVYIPLMRK